MRKRANGAFRVLRNAPFAHHARRVAAISLSLLLVCEHAASAPSTSGGDVARPAEWCGKLSARLPGVSSSSCQAAALAPSGAVSLNGFPILKRDIPAKAAQGGQSSQAARVPVRILLLGGIHGDELTASAIVFHWLRYLLAEPAPEFQWSVIPVLNPDGLLAAKPVRMNAHGVDLNRNFPTPGWEREAPRYWAKVTRRDPRRFPGKAPLSEPETRWLHDEMERFKPHVVISVHAPFGVLDFDGPAPAPARFGRLLINPVGVYPGSLGNYSGRHKNVPVITIELPSARTMPPPEEVRRIWLDMTAWIRANMPPRQAALVEAAITKK